MLSFLDLKITEQGCFFVILGINETRKLVKKFVSCHQSEMGWLHNFCVFPKNTKVYLLNCSR